MRKTKLLLAAILSATMILGGAMTTYAASTDVTI